MYVAKRPLKVGEVMVNIGEEVPGAEDWPRRESWERFGFIEYQAKPAPKKAVVQRRTQ